MCSPFTIIKVYKRFDRKKWFHVRNLPYIFVIYLFFVQEPEYLLQKLKKGGNRMDQIKRQLVVQRGAIVAALKILAQSRSAGSLSSYKSSDNSSTSTLSDEKAQTLSKFET